MHTKQIPSSGEELPVIGLGTWQGFDIGNDPDDRAPRKEILNTLFDGGGAMVDSSPMYHRAEGVTGDLLEGMGAHNKAFIATKVWTAGRAEGIAEMNRSFALLKTDTIDLMQVHNLVDLNTQMKTMRTWKEEGRFRYLGVTHYAPGAIDKVLDAIRSHDLDFVQMMYSLDEPQAADQLLPLCQDKGVAFIANRPLGGSGRLRRLRNTPLPGWALEMGIDSWARFSLKFTVAHPGVTCAIPGTGNPQNMADNMGAGYGPIPDEKQQAEMLGYWRAL